MLMASYTPYGDARCRFQSRKWASRSCRAAGNSDFGRQLTRQPYRGSHLVEVGRAVLALRDMTLEPRSFDRPECPSRGFPAELQHQPGDSWCRVIP
jgi:hypothetical protein